MRNKRKFIAIIEWHDAEVNDADEIAVWASSAASARRKARAEWRRRNAQRWPTARIGEVMLFTPAHLRRVLELA